MTTMTTTTSINSPLDRYRQLKAHKAKVEGDIKFSQARLQNAQEILEVTLKEQKRIENSLQALKDAKPILSAQSIEQCEKLANSALESIFETDARLKYSPEEARFVIDKGEFDTDLVSGNGGGYLAVISLVFNLFLLMKMHRRRLLCFDEQFTQISDEYISKFYEFLRVLSHELDVDILLISHDSRLTDDMVDHLYYLDNGKTIKSK